MESKADKANRESGNKKSAIKIFTDNRPTDKQGKPLPMALGKVAACVAHYRRWKRPLKTIYLCPAYYNIVLTWTKKKASEAEADARTWNMLTFDGVEIVQMSKHHIIKSREGSDQMDWDFYEPKPITEA